jgi:hypothetical protein
MAAKYRRLSPFFLLRRLAEYELEDVDRFVAWSEQQGRARGRYLEKLPPSNGPDDQFVDDFAEIDAFTSLYTGSAIVALWRCVELFRRRAIAQALGTTEAKSVYRHRDFSQMLARLRISDSKIRCARSVDELRCINNAVKHEGRVGKELAGFPRWKKRHGEELDDLRSHYARLRPLTKRYIEDLTTKATRWWEHKPA